MHNINVEAMADILHELGVTVAPEQIEKIVKDYDLHLELMRESFSYQHIGHKTECNECARLKSELKEITAERDVYQNSVKIRRNASSVWIEGDEVKYER